ncbi:hypothetical protein PMAYCL1PPCAC_07447 [Pristionchus mayeri]|uniref:Ankyrin repeat-containing protein n=1 Tax=Pristionchus mayeri TaxID=1317129 RepID=A0AAN4Z9X7_9BILA|nr:hypothetical protein PMAYCL1PPCAC_07447 [Pristionchus mayeri]
MYRCSCCPHGYHIDTGFVEFAEEVAAGKRGPSGSSRTQQLRKEERRGMMSPVGSLMSDSIENMMSDLEDALARETRRVHGPSHSAHSTIHRSNQFDSLNSGYISDSSTYRGTPISFSATGAAPRPPTRGTSRGTAAQTALGRALNAARVSESPTPQRMFSPVHGESAPVDPLSPSWRRRPFPSSTPSTPSLVQSELRSRVEGLPPPPPPIYSPPTNSLGEIYSSRRSRESELSSSRNRYFSTSPKMPRRLVSVTPIDDFSSPDFVTPPVRPTALYAGRETMANGSTPPSAPFTPYSQAPTFPVRDVVDASCWTGPPTPAKPCLECSQWRAMVEELTERLNRPVSDAAAQTTTAAVKEVGVATEVPRVIDAATDANAAETSEKWSETERRDFVHFHVQTDEVEEEVKAAVIERATSTVQKEVRDVIDRASDAVHVEVNENEAQTEEVVPSPREISEREMEESSWILPNMEQVPSADQNEKDEEEKKKNLLGKDENANGLTPQQSPVSDPPPDYEMIDEVDEELDSEVIIREEKDERTESPEKIEMEKEEKDEIEEKKEEEEKEVVVEKKEEESRKLGEDELSSLKKLLVSDEGGKAFVRGGVFRSLRARTSKSTEDEDDLRLSATTTDTSTPSEKPSEALKGKIALKKAASSDSSLSVPPVVSKIPEPRDARIPRPKFVKHVVETNVRAETEDEEDEAADRLTPLRSELRTLGSWPSAVASSAPVAVPPPIEEETCSDSESDVSEGSYDTNEQDDGPFEPSEPLIDAIKTLDGHVTGAKQKQEAVEWAMKLVQHEWLKTAASRSAKVERVSSFLGCVKEHSDNLHEFIINIDDANENTALHYAVSNGNLTVASLLLDFQADVDIPNRAGYSPLMLAALVDLKDTAEVNIIHRLFRAGDVNKRAQPHGQTALMLAVSHGKLETAKLLIECGGDVNVQDEEGSTALMCAAEHGHKALVQLLLSAPSVDAGLFDCDSSTALSIAVENGHKEIGLLIYAHQKRHNETAI